jgi:hypothetical protein
VWLIPSEIGKLLFYWTVTELLDALLEELSFSLCLIAFCLCS